MKILLLDDSEAFGRYISKVQPAGSDCKVFYVDPSYYGSKESLDDFFHAILNKKAWRMAGNVQGEESQSLKSLMGNASEKCLFLIYVNLKPTEYSTRQDQEGIELLKHIRLTDNDELGESRNAHVILYSFEEQLTLLQRKPGNLIMLSEGVTFLRLPDGLNTMATPAELVKLTDKRADVDRKDFKRFVQCDYQPPDSAHQFSNWWGLRQIALARREVLSNSNISMPDVVKSNLALLENKKTQFLFSNSTIRAGEKISTLTKDVQRLIGEIPKGKINIVYVDDESEWGKFINKSLAEDLRKNIDFSYRRPSDQILKDYQLLRGWIDQLLKIGGENGPSLVLLDLRLLGDKEIDVRAPDTSGAKIVRIIRDLAPGLPIILATASNKAYSYEAAMKIGVDGYWMKEGVGEHAAQVGSYTNYLTLLLLVAKALGPEYQLLKRLSRGVASLKNAHKRLWWESYRWPDKTTTVADRATLVRFLDGIVILLREYLRLFCMNYGFRGEDDRIEQSWISVLMVESVKPLELVHQQDYYGVRIVTAPGGGSRTETVSFSKLSRRRKDVWGNVLNDCRNLGAHAQGGNIALEWAHARSTLSGVMAWLMADPTTRDNSPQGIWGDSTFLRFNGGAVAQFPQKPTVGSGPHP